jgi:hypothetical protein
VEWLEPWWSVAEAEPDLVPGLAHELRREVAPGHPLYGIPVEAIGTRGDNDDVLFRLTDGSGRVAVVHLTWTQSPSERPPWPATQLYPSLEAWVEQCMRPNHDEYFAEPPT